MKESLIIISILVFGCTVKGQTFDEWFRQKKTQTKYLSQQITALQVYASYLEKGYTIAQTGLKTINDLKHGDLLMHSNYLNSLKRVNPALTATGKPAAISQFRSAIIEQEKICLQKVNTSGQFNQTERNYTRAVFSSVLDHCTDIEMEMFDVSTSGRLEMKDAERIKRIDKLYEGMKETYSFIQSFAAQLQVQALQRQREANDIKSTRNLYGIK